MAAIGAVVSFYRSSAVIKRFRISFRDELKSLTMFKPDLENFLGLKDKARELGVNSFELKLFRLTKLTGANDCQNYAIYTQERWDPERPLLLESSRSELNSK